MLIWEIMNYELPARIATLRKALQAGEL